MSPARPGAPLRHLAPLAVALLACACHDQPTSALPERAPTSQPIERSHAVGGYHVTFTGIGTPDQTATVVAEGGAGSVSLEARAVGDAAAMDPVPTRGLTARPNPSFPLELQIASTGFHSVGTRGSAGAYRYVYAAYRIRNASATTLRNLVLLGAASDATFGGTAISNIKLPGDVAPAPATGVLLAQGMLPAGASFPGRTGDVTGDRADVLQIFPEADLAAAPLPSPYVGLPYGFMVLDTATNGRTIAPTAAGNYPAILMFAFRVPLQATASQDVMTFRFNFYAVTDAESRVTQSAEEQSVASAAAVAARATAIGATATHVFRGSTLATPGLATVFCGVRTAGTQAAPTAFLGASCANELASLGAVTTQTGFPVAVIQPAASDQLVASVTAANGFSPPLGVAYASANPAVASVSPTGLVSGVSEGSTTVYVSAYASPSLLRTVQIHVDGTPPIVEQTAGPSSNLATTSTAAQVVQFAGMDNMGFGTNPIGVIASRLARAATGTVSDVAASNPEGAALGQFCATAVDPIAGTLQFATTPGGTCPRIWANGMFQTPAGLNGTYQLDVRARDQAGNLSAAITRTITVDTKAPSVSPPLLSPSTLSGAAAVTVTASASDNLQLATAAAGTQYGTALALREPAIAVPAGALNGARATDLALGIASLRRSVTLASAGVPSATAPVPADAALASFFDLPGGRAVASTPITGATLPSVPATPVFATGSPSTNVQRFEVALVDPSTGTPTAANPTLASTTDGGAYTSLRVNVELVGAVGTFSPSIIPGDGMELWIRVGTVNGAPEYRFLISVPSDLVMDVAGPPAVRRVRSAVTLLPSHLTSLTAGASGTATVELRAIGTTTNGDALVSDPISLTLRWP